MQKKRPWLSLSIAIAVGVAAGLASAADIDFERSQALRLAPAALGTATWDGRPRAAPIDGQRLPRPRAQTRSERRLAADNNGPARADATRRNRNRSAGAAAGTSPRLRLDDAAPPPSEESVAIDQAIEVLARAAVEARAAASAASAARARIAALERSVDELRDEAGQAASLRAGLARAEDSARWLWPLVGLVLVLAGLALWLVRRLSALQQPDQARWRTDAIAAAPVAPALAAPPRREITAPLPLAAAEVRPAARLPLPPAWPPPAPAEPWNDTGLQATQPMSTPSAAHEFVPDSAIERTPVPGVRSGADDAPSSPRDVSIEELIDLEQQAEFFVVLGQDDAAIELLTEHLRNTGGSSPLPYLKLLEIYRRRGDKADYERTRARFNRRFNAYAPEWGSDLGGGRSLEDYPGVLPRLQQAWSRPLDAMAEMEALLFRKSRGDLFELPAYRELLFLYSLARDLLDREAADTGSVDLLLPLADAERGSEFGSTAPLPYLGLESDPAHDWQDGNEDRPTLPLDFDLSAEAERQTSIFDPLDQHGRPVPRR